ncbi:hypothetical protein FRC18_000807 [Serendipita sp. 400]|nr:hypothetical protein FRC18_000807 [Serendipita sp. 400]
MGCGIKTRRFDTNTGSYFDYCGLHCRNAVRNGNWGASPLNGQTTTAAASSSSFVPQQIRSGQPVQNPSSSNCIAPNCNRPRWYNPQQGDYSLFCSIKCRNANPHLQSQQQPQRSQPQPSHAPAVVGSSLGQRACVICKSAPYDAARESLFCGYACLKKAEAMAPGIIEIPMSHPKFRNIAHQFTQKWLHTNVAFRPPKHIYIVLQSATQKASYARYKAKVEREGNFVASGRTEGNENRRFHGSTRQCRLGDPGNTQLCSNTNCPLCGILRTSFDLAFFKVKTGFARFGRGHYTTATSSKSDSYSTNGSTSSYKAIIMTKVVVGRGYKMTQNAQTLTAPPTGFHSVLGEPVQGGKLNYDELVVYDNDAIRPAYLIVY